MSSLPARVSPALRSLAWVCLAIVPALLASASARAQDADATPPAAAAEEKSLADELRLDPQAKLDELVEFLERVGSLKPSAASRAELVEWVKQTRQALIEAADKILNSAEADAATLERAALVQLEAWRLLARAGVDDVGQKLQALGERIDKLGLAELASRARMAALSSRLPELVAAEGENRQKLSEEFKQQILQAPADALSAMAAYQLVDLLGNLDENDLAAAACGEFATRFATASDPQAREVAARLAGLGRRLGLLGAPFAPFSGKSLDGKTFDLASLAGKVVLIDFWATWCGPCVAEIPNVRRNYDAYHAQGFEVVGVSLDDDRGALEKFLAENQLPWTTVLGSEALVAEGGQPLAEYYGVSSIPTVILIGADGQVKSTSARGEELGRLLEELLGPAGSGSEG